MINFYKSIPNGPFHHGWEMGVLDNKLKDVLSSEWCSIYTTMTIKYLWNKSQNSSSDVELFEGWINNWIINSLIGQAFFLAREVIFNVSMSGWVCQNTCANATKKKKGDKKAKKGIRPNHLIFLGQVPLYPLFHVPMFLVILSHWIMPWHTYVWRFEHDLVAHIDLKHGYLQNWVQRILGLFFSSTNIWILYVMEWNQYLHN